MYQKQQQNNYHASENISLMVANVTQIKSGAMINAGVSAKIQKISSVQKNYIWDPATISHYFFSNKIWTFFQFVFDGFRFLHFHLLFTVLQWLGLYS